MTSDVNEVARHRTRRARILAALSALALLAAAVGVLGGFALSKDDQVTALSSAIRDQSEVLASRNTINEYLAAVAEHDVCVDDVLGRYLSGVGDLIVRDRTQPRNSEAIERLQRAIEDFRELDKRCPVPAPASTVVPRRAK